MNKFFKIIFFLGVLYNILLLLSGDYTNDTKAMLSIFAINCFLAFLVCFLLKNNKYSCKIAFFLIVLTNILFLENTTGWNEGSMSGSSYVIPFFQYITDWLYGFLLVSAFIGGIPVIVYLLFIYSIVLFFCKRQNKIL